MDVEKQCTKMVMKRWLTPDFFSILLYQTTARKREREREGWKEKVQTLLTYENPQARLYKGKIISVDSKNK